MQWFHAWQQLRHHFYTNRSLYIWWKRCVVKKVQAAFHVWQTGTPARFHIDGKYWCGPIGARLLLGNQMTLRKCHTAQFLVLIWQLEKKCFQPNFWFLYEWQSF